MQWALGFSFLLKEGLLIKDKIWNGKERREHFRVKHPYRERPKIIFLGNTYDIIDISEYGVRFCSSKSIDVKQGQVIHATINFPDGESLNIEGRVIRIQDSEIAVFLARGIPYKRIVKEQRYLMKKYPGHI